MLSEKTTADSKHTADDQSGEDGQREAASDIAADHSTDETEDDALSDEPAAFFESHLLRLSTAALKIHPPGDSRGAWSAARSFFA